MHLASRTAPAPPAPAPPTAAPLAAAPASDARPAAAPPAAAPPTAARPSAAPPAAAPAAATAASGSASAMTPDEWRQSCQLLSATPLLDLADIHPFVCANHKGRGAPPAPFEAVAAWAVAQFRSWGGGAPAASVRDWRYVRSAHPAERLLHLTASGTRYCFHKARAHKSQNVMVRGEPEDPHPNPHPNPTPKPAPSPLTLTTKLEQVTVDLLRGEAWQRCWDGECVHHRPRLLAGPRARAGVDGRLASRFPSPLTPAPSPPLHPTLTLTPHAAHAAPLTPRP